VGWGFTISNNTSDWLETLSLAAGSFTNGTPSVIFDFPSVVPNSFVTEDFTLIATTACAAPPCGLYDFTWDTTAAAGTVNSGLFTLGSELFSGNPSSSSSIDLGPAPDAIAPYSVSVTPPMTPVPEPSTSLLLLAGLAGMAAFYFVRLRFPAPLNRHNM
jgi:hypothetical protein